MSDEFIREVDEEVRQDRYQLLWKRYGRYVVVGAVAIVLATIGNVLWQNYQSAQRGAESRSFLQAITLASQDQNDAAIELLNSLSAKGSSGYALLARLREAGLLVHKGDSEAAAFVYSSIADDDSVSKLYRDFALLMAVMSEIGGISADDADARLAPIMTDDNPWRYSARELLAIASVQASQNDRARELLEANADDPGAPQGVRARGAASRHPRQLNSDAKLRSVPGGERQ